ncbi:hypothetical protein PRIPAC_85984, partial [Pristionchus pacificus]|uniref:P-type phospholipid transporter n=1 Tax=Pristionchus pacificus TaxID=54126 RepID=A0A2A6BP33_PRIPA
SIDQPPSSFSSLALTPHGREVARPMSANDSDNNTTSRKIVIGVAEGITNKIATTKINPDTSPYGPQSCSVPLCLQAGMIVYVTKGSSFPADLVLLSSSEPAGIAYIETSNLDGETNLKIRKGLPQTAGLVHRDKLTKELHGTTTYCEQPNKRLYSFQGNMQLAHTSSSTGANTIIDKSQFLQRGAKLRNTDWLYALVVYAGKETKFMLNSVRTKRKNARIHQLANYLMISQFGFLVMATVSYTYFSRSENVFAFIRYVYDNTSVPYQWNKSSEKFELKDAYTPIESVAPVNEMLFISLINFLVMFSSLDLEMYDERTDIAAEARSSMLTAELGEIKYVMADKTGTLTRNKMVFKNCSVGGVKYGSKKQESFNPRMVLSDLKSNRRSNSEDLHQFLTACAVCHTVVPEKKGDTVVMHASSPDEYALVGFASAAGFKFHTRTPSMIMFTEELDSSVTERSFEVLQVLEFDSVCKRMGMVVKREDGSLRLYVKGALDQPNNCRSRADLMHQVEEDLVRDMKLIGASAIEDRLQEKVPETIAKILSAGMHLWMLTGDKLETAINIGFSCNLISNKVTILVLKSPITEEVTGQLRSWLAQIGERRLQKGLRTALVVESSSLDLILADDGLTTDFLRLALASHAVICCRCTPLQKASVTRLVRQYSSGCVLAVGDGGNDIAMIQEAHVGVGIHGQEGNQAAMSADFSIAQFKHLDRLLFVHGSLSLFRTNRTLLYTIYKNTFEMAIVACFSGYTGFTVQAYTDTIHMICYALWYTCFPALMIGMFDQPTSINVIATSSSHYAPMQNTFTIKEYIKFLSAGALHSCVVFFSNWCLVMVANVKALYESRSLNWPMVASLTFSVTTPLLVMIEQSFAFPALPWGNSGNAGLIQIVPTFRFFFFIVFIVGIVVMLEIMFKGVYRLIIRRVYVADEYNAGTHIKLLQPLVRVKDLIRSKDVPRTGYAFSQDDGSVLSQSEMVRAYDSTVPKQAGSDLTAAEEQEKHNSIESNRQKGSLYNDKTVDSEGSPMLRSARDKSKSGPAMKSTARRPALPAISEVEENQPATSKEPVKKW